MTNYVVSKLVNTLFNKGLKETKIFFKLIFWGNKCPQTRTVNPSNSLELKVRGATIGIHNFRNKPAEQAAGADPSG